MGAYGCKLYILLQVPRPLLTTFHHDRCRAHKLLVGHRPVAIFRTAIWLLSGVTRSSSLGELFCWRYGNWTESVPVGSRTQFRTTAGVTCYLKIPIKSVPRYFCTCTGTANGQLDRTPQNPNQDTPAGQIFEFGRHDYTGCGGVFIPVFWDIFPLQETRNAQDFKNNVW